MSDPQSTPDKATPSEGNPASPTTGDTLHANSNSTPSSSAGLGDTIMAKFALWFGSDLARRNIDDNLERWTFIAILTLGSAAIFGFKAYAGMSAAAGLLISGLGIGGYATIAWLGRNNRVRMDKAGDNCYYLGLTFTLASLSAVLIKVNFEVALGSQIVAGFGIALGSTIFGIVTRLVLIQYVEELDDIDQRARTSLTDSAARLRNDLDDASSRFQRFLVALQDDVQASIITLTDEQLERQKKLIGEVHEVLETAATNLNNATKGLTAGLERHSGAMDKFNVASERSAKAAEQLAEKAEAFELPHDNLSEAVDRIVSEVDRIRDGLIALPFGEVGKELRGASEISSKLLGEMGGLVNSIAATSDQMSRLHDAVSQGANQSVEASKTLQQSAVELDRQTKSIKLLTEEYTVGLGEVADSLAAKLDE